MNKPLSQCCGVEQKLISGHSTAWKLVCSKCGKSFEPAENKQLCQHKNIESNMIPDTCKDCGMVLNEPIQTGYLEQVGNFHCFKCHKDFPDSLHGITCKERIEVNKDGGAVACGKLQGGECEFQKKCDNTHGSGDCSTNFSGGILETQNESEHTTKAGRMCRICHLVMEYDHSHPRKTNTIENWETGLREIAKEYANKSYLVSEESHDEIEEITALNNLVSFVKTLLSAEQEKNLKEERDRIVENIRLDLMEEIIDLKAKKDKEGWWITKQNGVEFIHRPSIDELFNEMIMMAGENYKSKIKSQ